VDHLVEEVEQTVVEKVVENKVVDQWVVGEKVDHLLEEVE
jgi:hypothetical protein